MICTITYNGKDFADFNVYIDGSKSFGSPEKDYEIIEIPGRNGDLSIYNNRFKDIEIAVPCYIKQNFIENYRNLMQYLNGVTGYQRFEISKEPDHYRKALFLGAVEPSTGQFVKSGRFTLNFRLNPQRWLKSSESLVDITNQSNDWTVNNPTNMPSKPLFDFRGNGEILIKDSLNTTIYGKITVTNNSGSDVMIDCETFDCYTITQYGVTNRNADVTFNVDPELKIGENYISWTSSQSLGTVIEIAPRFFVI